jgi:hypothetical protein
LKSRRYVLGRRDALVEQGHLLDWQRGPCLPGHVTHPLDPTSCASCASMLHRRGKAMFQFSWLCKAVRPCKQKFLFLKGCGVPPAPATKLPQNDPSHSGPVHPLLTLMLAARSELTSAGNALRDAHRRRDTAKQVLACACRRCTVLPAMYVLHPLQFVFVPQSGDGRLEVDLAAQTYFCPFESNPAC